MSEKPLQPWVLAETGGKILAAHCNCMAGLGEACSHIASLLFAVEAGVRARESTTVTDKKAYWVQPQSVKDVPYAPIKDICFLGKKRFAKMREQEQQQQEQQQQSLRQKNITPPSPHAKESFIAALAAASSKPAVLSVTRGYHEKYIPTALQENFPSPLLELYNKENLQLNYAGLLSIAKQTVISVTAEQREAVELHTREQYKARLWNRMRGGRITASKLKAVCCTNSASPSMSLIMSVCHPELSKFTTVATRWGCSHEKTAMKAYQTKHASQHVNVKVDSCGFVINDEHSFIGASPDGLISCDCCGDGVIEIKVYHFLPLHIFVKVSI